MVNLKKQGNNISQTSATLELICGEKIKTKKLLLSMTVTQLRALISKLFKIEVMQQELYYRGLEDTQDYLIDTDHR